MKIILIVISIFVLIMIGAIMKNSSRIIRIEETDRVKRLGVEEGE